MWRGVLGAKIRGGGEEEGEERERCHDDTADLIVFIYQPPSKAFFLSIILHQHHLRDI